MNLVLEISVRIVDEGFDWPAWIAAVASAILVGVACYALRQLTEIRRDRHVQVMVEMGMRWKGAEMTEALQASRDYTPNELAKLVEAARTGPIGDRVRAAAEKKMVVLLRVPNYFEDAGLIARVGRMKDDLIADYIGGVAIDEWKTWEPAVRKIQEKDSRAYEEFERLAKEDEREEIKKQATKEVRPKEASGPPLT
jgi:hypothetical protein